MQFYERDYFLYRILSDYVKFKDLKIINPTVDILYEAHSIYKEIYEQCKNDNVLDDKELYNFLLNIGEWTEEDENILTKIIPEKLEEIKVGLYERYLNPDELKKGRKYLNRAIQEQNTLYSKRHGYDYLTCEGTANFAKMNYIIEQTTFLENKKYDFELIKQHNVLEFIYNNYISESIVRELARYENWTMMWRASKKCSLFSQPAIEFSEDKKRLISWTLLYDNIYEAPDCPTETVISDDDVFDGWLILKRRENEKQKKESYLEKKLGKNAGAGEAFVVTNSKEEAEAIYGMNDEHSRAILNSRLNFIEKNGSVLDKDLPDVKQHVMMEMNRKAYAQR